MWSPSASAPPKGCRLIYLWPPRYLFAFFSISLAANTNTRTSSSSSSDARAEHRYTDTNTAGATQRSAGQAQPVKAQALTLIIYKRTIRVTLAVVQRSRRFPVVARQSYCVDCEWNWFKFEHELLLSSRVRLAATFDLMRS